MSEQIAFHQSTSGLFLFAFINRFRRTHNFLIHRAHLCAHCSLRTHEIFILINIKVTEIKLRSLTFFSLCTVALSVVFCMDEMRGNWNENEAVKEKNVYCAHNLIEMVTLIFEITFFHTGNYHRVTIFLQANKRTKYPFHLL